MSSLLRRISSAPARKRSRPGRRNAGTSAAYLHDGLGPVLAGLALGLEGAQDAVHQDPKVAENLLADLGAQATAAIEDVRRLVYGLRPPSLDDLGLLGAVREQANRLSVPSRGLVVRVDAPDRLPPLPAAVEVAAYRIVAEALTNVSRHAKAAHCGVEIRVRTPSSC